MNVLDLFSGIGGFSLGLERAGMRTVAFCEVDPFCQAVLRKHWPNIPIYSDVRDLTADRLRADGIAPDLICGGFPCQDISNAGKGAGIGGERSGLWAEYARLIGELRPRYVIVENVSALLSRGLDVVLGGLAALRYDAEWHCIHAADVGAPHLRDRLWLVAYPQHPDANGSRSHRAPIEQLGSSELRDQQDGLAGSVCSHVADPDSSERWPNAAPRRSVQRSNSLSQGQEGPGGFGAGGEALANAGEARLSPSKRETLLGARWWQERRAVAECGWWSSEPDVGRVAHGVSSRVDRLKSLGNAVVPQIPEIIGRAIMAAAE